MDDKITLEGIFENGYGFISKKVMQDKDLSLSAKGIYAYICSYSGKGKDVFPSRSKMCFDLNVSNDTLGKYIKELKDKDYIEITHTKSKGKFTNNIYKVCTNLPYTKTPCPKISDTDKLDTNNNNKYNNKKNNNILIVEQVIDYMNELAGTSFKKSTTKTQSLIKARLKEGFTLDDLKDVVYYKYNEWYKNPITFKNGISSSTYFRPNTLFSTNFEEYLETYKREYK